MAQRTGGGGTGGAGGYYDANGNWVATATLGAMLSSASLPLSAEQRAGPDAAPSSERGGAPTMRLRAKPEQEQAPLDAKAGGPKNLGKMAAAAAAATAADVAADAAAGAAADAAAVEAAMIEALMAESMAEVTLPGAASPQGTDAIHSFLFPRRDDPLHDTSHVGHALGLGSGLGEGGVDSASAWPMRSPRGVHPEEEEAPSPSPPAPSPSRAGAPIPCCGRDEKDLVKCFQLHDREGGVFGCTLLAHHAGPHVGVGARAHRTTRYRPEQAPPSKEAKPAVAPQAQRAAQHPEVLISPSLASSLGRSLTRALGGAGGSGGRGECEAGACTGSPTLETPGFGRLIEDVESHFRAACGSDSKPAPPTPDDGVGDGAGDGAGDGDAETALTACDGCGRRFSSGGALGKHTWARMKNGGVCPIPRKVPKGEQAATRMGLEPHGALPAGGPDNPKAKRKIEGSSSGPEPPSKQPVPPGKRPAPPGKGPVPPGKRSAPPGKGPVPPSKRPAPPGKGPEPPGKRARVR